MMPVQVNDRGSMDSVYDVTAEGRKMVDFIITYPVNRVGQRVDRRVDFGQILT